jgi:hypothetical protein
VADGNEHPRQWVQYWGTYSAMDKAAAKPFKVKFILDASVKNGRLVMTYLWFDRLSGFHQLGKHHLRHPLRNSDASRSKDRSEHCGRGWSRCGLPFFVPT